MEQLEETKMTTVQDTLKLKQVQIDTWSPREQLCLASAVLRSGDQNWVSVTRALKLFAEPNRPPDWFNQKSCALQYSSLLEKVDTPKRKRGEKGELNVETPGEAIVRKLTLDRIEELKKGIEETKTKYHQLKDEIHLVTSDKLNRSQLESIWAEIEEDKRKEEAERVAYQKWLKEREEKKLAILQALRNQKIPLYKKRGLIRQTRRTSMQSEDPGSETESTLDGLLDDAIHVDVTGDELLDEPNQTVLDTTKVKPNSETTRTSPLLSNLLKSPSQSCIPGFMQSIVSNTITPGLKTLLPLLVKSNPSVGVSEGVHHSKLVASGMSHSTAPTLSMLLELPLSTPGQPLPEIASIMSQASTIEPEFSDAKSSQVVSEEIQISASVLSIHNMSVSLESKPITLADALATIHSTQPPLQAQLRERASSQDMKLVLEDIEEIIKADTSTSISTISTFASHSDSPFIAVTDMKLEKSFEDLDSTLVLPDSEEHNQSFQKNFAVQDKVLHEEIKEKVIKLEIVESSQEVDNSEDIEVASISSRNVSSTLQEDKKSTPTSHAGTPTPSTASRYYRKRVGLRTRKGNKNEEKAEVNTVTIKVEPGSTTEDKAEIDDPYSEASLLKDISKDSMPPVLRRTRPIKIDRIAVSITPQPVEETNIRQTKRTPSTPATPVDSIPGSPVTFMSGEDEKDYKSWKKSIMLVWGRVAAHKFASKFLKPITNDQAPGYGNVVYKPMDLQTIKRNIELGVIRSTLHFQHDLLQMFANAMMYNPADHDVHKMSMAMYKDARQHLEDFKNTQLLVTVERHKALRRETRDSLKKSESSVDSEDFTKRKRRETSTLDDRDRKRRKITE